MDDSYDEKPDREKNYKHSAKIENILKVWRIKKLLMEGQIMTVFKSPAVSKVTHLVIVTKLKTTYCSTTI